MRFEVEQTSRGLSAIAELYLLFVATRSFIKHARWQHHVHDGTAIIVVCLNRWQVRYWDVPMVTAGAMAGGFGTSKKRDYPLLTRVGPNFNSLSEFIISTLQLFGSVMSFPDSTVISDRCRHYILHES